MSEPRGPAEESVDPAADTGRFRAFVDGRHREAHRGRAVGAPFRILTLLMGLAALGVVVWLLFLL